MIELLNLRHLEYKIKVLLSQPSIAKFKKAKGIKVMGELILDKSDCSEEIRQKLLRMNLELRRNNLEIALQECVYKWDY